MQIPAAAYCMPPVSSDIVNLKAGFPGLTFYPSIHDEERGKKRNFRVADKTSTTGFQGKPFLKETIYLIAIIFLTYIVCQQKRTGDYLRH